VQASFSIHPRIQIAASYDSWLASAAELEQPAVPALLDLQRVSIRKPKDIALRINEKTLANHERRNRLRFPLNTELRYQISRRGHGEEIRGTGQVQNISSKGLAFRADRPLEVGLQLKVSMAWPAKLDNQCMLRLVFEGIVQRTQDDLVVLTIEHPEFRTAGKCTEATREELSVVAKGIEALLASKGAACGDWRARDRQMPMA